MLTTSQFVCLWHWLSASDRFDRNWLGPKRLDSYLKRKGVDHSFFLHVSNHHLQTYHFPAANEILPKCEERKRNSYNHWKDRKQPTNSAKTRSFSIFYMSFFFLFLRCVVEAFEGRDASSFLFPSTYSSTFSFSRFFSSFSFLFSCFTFLFILPYS